MKCGGVLSSLWITTSFPGFDCKSLQSLPSEDLKPSLFCTEFTWTVWNLGKYFLLLLNNIPTFRNVSGFGNRWRKKERESYRWNLFFKMFSKTFHCAIHFNKISFFSFLGEPHIFLCILKTLNSNSTDHGEWLPCSISHLVKMKANVRRNKWHVGAMQKHFRLSPVSFECMHVYSVFIFWSECWAKKHKCLLCCLY